MIILSREYRIEHDFVKGKLAPRWRVVEREHKRSHGPAWYEDKTLNDDLTKAKANQLASAYRRHGVRQIISYEPRT